MPAAAERSATVPNLLVMSTGTTCQSLPMSSTLATFAAPSLVRMLPTGVHTQSPLAAVHIVMRSIDALPVHCWRLESPPEPATGAPPLPAVEEPLLLPAETGALPPLLPALPLLPAPKPGDEGPRASLPQEAAAIDRSKANAAMSLTSGPLIFYHWPHRRNHAQELTIESIELREPRFAYSRQSPTAVTDTEARRALEVARRRSSAKVRTPAADGDGIGAGLSAFTGRQRAAAHRAGGHAFIVSSLTGNGRLPVLDERELDVRAGFRVISTTELSFMLRTSRTRSSGGVGRRARLLRNEQKDRAKPSDKP